MIYPTRRAILVMALGAPIAMIVGLIAPGFWVAGAAWMALIAALCLMDAALGSPRDLAQVALEAPGVLPTAGTETLTLRAHFDRRPPASVEVAVETNARLAVSPERRDARSRDGDASASFELSPVRRGEGEITRFWMRWTGPLGLVWKQVVETPRRTVAITPNVRAVKDEAIRLFARDAAFGIKTQLETGDGSEFHALRELVGGMDRRTIDWKQSARHGKLLGKEFRTERNHPVIFAIDTGRLMCEPLLGVPRIDRAINAALLLAFVSLKLGDRAGFFGFDVKPRLFTGAVSGASAFPLLQRFAARLDYSPEETNYTLALTQLGAALERRSLIVIFTDFADTTSAELMLENVGRLLKRHLVLFVVFRDEELEAIARREPTDPEAVSRSVTAEALLRERDLVIARLTRLGAHIVDAPVQNLNAALLSSYIDLKRRDLM
ncbi:MAG: DUF58 domain-containing protein [Caulobacterales bacterium]